MIQKILIYCLVTSCVLFPFETEGACDDTVSRCDQEEYTDESFKLKIPKSLLKSIKSNINNRLLHIGCKQIEFKIETQNIDKDYDVLYFSFKAPKDYKLLSKDAILKEFSLSESLFSFTKTDKYMVIQPLDNEYMIGYQLTDKCVFNREDISTVKYENGEFQFKFSLLGSKKFNEKIADPKYNYLCYIYVETSTGYKHLYLFLKNDYSNEYSIKIPKIHSKLMEAMIKYPLKEK